MRGDAPAERGGMRGSGSGGRAMRGLRMRGRGSAKAVGVAGQSHVQRAPLSYPQSQTKPPFQYKVFQVSCFLFPVVVEGP